MEVLNAHIKMKVLVLNWTVQSKSSSAFLVNAVECVLAMIFVLETNAMPTQHAETWSMTTSVTAKRVSGATASKSVLTSMSVWGKACLMVIVVVIIPAVSTLLALIIVSVSMASNRKAKEQRQHPVSVSALLPSSNTSGSSFMKQQITHSFIHSFKLWIVIVYLLFLSIYCPRHVIIIDRRGRM